ncbi:LCP family protein [Leucobacter japonicus]|uniref:LCP family protein n=1 Tax=Leucobacter japonicus TaxID=1461259 RepID=UPI0009497F5E|nr:LCP family protein [Leucobacter japonicus]
MRQRTRQKQSQGPQRSQRLRRVMISIGAACALVLVGIGGIALFGVQLTHSFDGQVEVLTDAEVFPDESTRPDVSDRGELNILVLASDSRGDVAEVTEDEESTGQRSDVVMLVHVDAARQHVQVMSLMRDSWVDVPGHGPAKINAAMSWGGTPLAVQTIEQLLGVRIDHVALIGFEGFEQMTDALGGVSVYVPAPFAEGGFRFEQGQTDMQGKQALVFVRQRYAFAAGDFQRVKNQQAFIRALANRAISGGTLTSPTKMAALVDAIARNLSVDRGFTSQRMLEIGFSLGEIRPSNVAYFTVPASGTGMEGDQSVVYIDEAGLAELRDALATDTVDQFAATRP